MRARQGAIRIKRLIFFDSGSAKQQTTAGIGVSVTIFGIGGGFRQAGGGWSITAVHLDLAAKVSGIDQAKLESLANDAKANCPVSKVLNAKITLAAKLEK